MAEVRKLSIRNEKEKYFVIHLRGSTTNSFGPYDKPVKLQEFVEEIQFEKNMEYVEDRDTLISIKVDDWGMMETEVLANKHLSWVIAQRSVEASM